MEYETPERPHLLVDATAQGIPEIVHGAFTSCPSKQYLALTVADRLPAISRPPHTTFPAIKVLFCCWKRPLSCRHSFACVYRERDRGAIRMKLPYKAQSEMGTIGERDTGLCAPVVTTAEAELVENALLCCRGISNPQHGGSSLSSLVLPLTPQRSPARPSTFNAPLYDLLMKTLLPLSIVPLLLSCLDLVDAVRLEVHGRSPRWENSASATAQNRGLTVEKRSNIHTSNGSGILTNADDITYYSSLTLGGKVFSVLIDTGESLHAPPPLCFSSLLTSAAGR
jgi:hypothetical protein